MNLLREWQVPIALALVIASVVLYIYGGTLFEVIYEHSVPLLGP